jgi:sulfur relay (sulfurtransferase) DsrC/TusE family protein
MSLAEKYYRKFYKVKEDVKLSNEQWKVVKMMHECLREYNKPKLPQGSILVNKKELVSHLRHVKECLKNTDELMLNKMYRDFSNGSGGTELAKIWNALNLTIQSILHFQLNIPLERLNEEIPD